MPTNAQFLNEASFIQDRISATITDINIEETAIILAEVINQKMAVSLIPSLIQSMKLAKRIPITGRKLICMHFNAYASLDTNELLSYLTTANIPPYFLKEMFICAINLSFYKLAESISCHAGLYCEQISWFTELCSKPMEYAIEFKNLMTTVFEHPAFNPDYSEKDDSPISIASRHHNFQILELLLKCQRIDVSKIAPYIIRRTDDPIILQMLLEQELDFKDVVPMAMCDSLKMPQSVKIAIYEKYPQLDPSTNNSYALAAACICCQVRFARYLLSDPRITNVQHIFDTIVSLKYSSEKVYEYLYILDMLLQHQTIVIRPETIRSCNSFLACITLFEYLRFNQKHIQKYFACAFGDMSLVSIGQKFNMSPLKFIQSILKFEPCLEFNLHSDDWTIHELALFYTSNKLWIKHIDYEYAMNPLTIVAQCGYVDVFTHLMETNIDPSMHSNAALIAAAERHKEPIHIRKNKDKIVDMLLTDVRVLICGIHAGKLPRKQTIGLIRKINSLLVPLLIAQKRAMVNIFASELYSKVSLQ